MRVNDNSLERQIDQLEKIDGIALFTTQGDPLNIKGKEGTSDDNIMGGEESDPNEEAKATSDRNEEEEMR